MRYRSNGSLSSKTETVYDDYDDDWDDDDDPDPEEVIPEGTRVEELGSGSNVVPISSAKSKSPLEGVAKLEDLVREFHTKTGTKGVEDYLPENIGGFWKYRLNLLAEEYDEFLDEIEPFLKKGDKGDLPKLAKEGADLAVVIIGLFDLLGIPFTAVFNEVMASNMSKIGDDGKVDLRADGKVLKGSHYKPAYTEPYVYMAHKMLPRESA